MSPGIRTTQTPVRALPLTEWLHRGHTNSSHLKKKVLAGSCAQKLLWE